MSASQCKAQCSACIKAYVHAPAHRDDMLVPASTCKHMMYMGHQDAWMLRGLGKVIHVIFQRRSTRLSRILDLCLQGNSTSAAQNSR